MNDIIPDLMPTEENSIIRELDAQLQSRRALNDDLRAENTMLRDLLIRLTPGGSEFHGSPKRCAEWAQDRISMTMKIAAQRNRMRAALGAIEHQAQSEIDPETCPAEFILDAIEETARAALDTAGELPY